LEVWGDHTTAWMQSNAGAVAEYRLRVSDNKTTSEERNWVYIKCQ